jgi:hypothetical protein
MGEAFNWGSAHKDATTFLDGEFPFVIEEVTVKQTAAAGKTMFAMKVTVESGVHAGRTMKHNITVSPESPVAMRIFFQDMETLGLSAQYFDNPVLNTEAGPEMIAQAITGKRFIGVCTPREWNDRKQDSIEGIKPPSKRPLGPGAVVASGPSVGIPRATPQSSVPTPSATPTPAAAAVPTPSATPVATPVATPAVAVPAPPVPPGEDPAF